MFKMTGRESKKSKSRRNLYSHAKGSSSSGHNTKSGHSGGGSVTTPLGATGGAAASPFTPFGSGVTMNVCDVTTEFGSLKTVLPKVPTSEELVSEQKITELMDAPVDIDIPSHAISRGQNPYLNQCMYCSTPRTEAQDGDEGLELLDLQLDGNAVINSPPNTQSFSSLKLEIWTCAKCRKVAGNFQTFLEANLPQSSYDVPSFLHEPGKCLDSMSCKECMEERDMHERETVELQDNWVELRCIVKDLYGAEEEPVLSEEIGDRLKFLVDRLCSRDPHQLFLRLESQVRELVVAIKASLLDQLATEGYSTPEQALAFTSIMLHHYDLLARKAHLLAQYLGGLSEHLSRFKVTWELLNKHLFQFIVHIDPTINNSGPTILEQLRQGSLKYERSREDPFCVVRKRLLKFQEQMSVVVVVWRDCQQLIENYCQEEVKNTQKQVQILKEHLIKEPLMDEALSETMRNLMSGHKSTTERVMCHRCKRERCTCDECTITHMITCGIINSDKGEIPPPPNSFNFALDHTRNVMDITPPSMSSTTSSSGSVSPINIEDKLTTFYDCEKALKEEFPEALLNCSMPDGKSMLYNGECSPDDIDDNAGDDEDEEDEEDEYLPDSQDAGSDQPHTLQFQPRLDPELSRQLDAELAKSGLLPGGAEGAPGGVEEVADVLGSGDSAGVFAACQCHACLKQSGHMISTSLPLQVPVSTVPQSLHLYSHIYGDGLPQPHPQQRFMFDIPSPVLPQVKMPGMQDHIYHAYSDWDNSMTQQPKSSEWDNSMAPRPGSLAAQHQHQHHQRLLTSDLLPPAPLTSHPFTLDSLAPHLTSHHGPHTLGGHTLGAHTATTTSTASAFKSMAGKHLASSILPNLGNFTAEGSSVDPTKPLDFAALAQKIPQSCLNVNPTSLASFSVPSSFSAPSSGLNTSSSVVSSKSSGSSHGPPCSRPPPLGGNAASSKWERTQHPPHCKKMTSGFLNKPVSGGLSSAPHPPHSAPPPLPPSQAGLKNPGSGGGGTAGNHPQDVFKNLRSCAHANNPGLRPRAPMPDQPAPHSGHQGHHHPSNHQAPPPVCSNPNSLPSVVNNIGVGTTLPDSAYEQHHHDDNCDSVDDSCSEKSSSTSASNQKEGKYCDCCYCEFFGHNNAQVAKTSTNYAEMKDRLRKKLKKRTESKHKDGDIELHQPGICEAPKEIIEHECHEHTHNMVKEDPLEREGLEALLSFINGKDRVSEQSKKDKEASAKAAKRARQKLKKLEEKARLEKSNSPCEKKREPEPSHRHPLHNHTNHTNHTCKAEFDPKVNMGKPKHPSHPKQIADLNKKEYLREHHIHPITSQEIPRSSLIIESTRATISRSAKDLDKVITSQHNHQLNHNNGIPQNMIHFLENSLKNDSVKAMSKVSESIPTPAELNKQLRVVLQPKKSQKSSQSNNNLTNGKVLNGKGLPNGKVAVSQSTILQQNHIKPASSTTVINNKPTHQPHTINGSGKKGMPAPQPLLQPPFSKATPTAPPPSVPTPKPSVADSPSAGSSSSASQSPSSGTKSEEGTKPTSKAKKSKKKNKNGDLSGVDEIFMPKPENELEGIVDEFDRELEEFKRFCLDTQQPTQRRKIPVNVNLKDIFKKKTGLV